ncbi:hypothetical protein EDD85DRAFT_798552 [Armillaria nabsnona]|nr:hypothetical protein EDD85DRAFT_798552 [Armillaria nabsnona]
MFSTRNGAKAIGKKNHKLQLQSKSAAYPYQLVHLHQYRDYQFLIAHKLELNTNPFGTEITNSQPIQPTNSMNMSASTQKMPRPMARDTPRFDGNNSENISITDDAKKKKQLVHYADVDTEEEWKSLDKYSAGTFAKFKGAIIKNYPEAQDTESGTINRLTCITCSFKNLGLDEWKEYLKFKRKLLTEARKLEKPPLIITNQELVTKFLEALSPMFRENVSERLSIKCGLKSSLTPAAAALVAASETTATATAPTPAKAIVRWEDLHTLAEVVAKVDNLYIKTGYRVLSNKPSNDKLAGRIRGQETIQGQALTRLKPSLSS